MDWHTPRGFTREEDDRFKGDGLLMEGVDGEKQVIDARIAEQVYDIRDAGFIPAEKTVGYELSLFNATLRGRGMYRGCYIWKEKRLTAERHYRAHVDL